MPHPAQRRVEGLGPFVSKVFRNAPAHGVVPKSHSHQVAFLHEGIAVDEAFASMKNSQVIDEVNVPGLGFDFQSGCFCNGFDGVQCFDLDCAQLGQIGWSRVARTTQQGGPAKVGNHLAVVVEQDRSAMETRSVRSQLRASIVLCVSCLLSTRVGGLDVARRRGGEGGNEATHKAKGQSDRASARTRSGREAARAL